MRSSPRPWRAGANGGPGPASIALSPQRRWDVETPLATGCSSWWSHDDDDGEVERGAGDYVTAVAKMLWIYTAV